MEKMRKEDQRKIQSLRIAGTFIKNKLFSSLDIYHSCMYQSHIHSALLLDVPSVHGTEGKIKK